MHFFDISPIFFIGYKSPKLKFSTGTNAPKSFISFIISPMSYFLKKSSGSKFAPASSSKSEPSTLGIMGSDFGFGFGFFG